MGIAIGTHLCRMTGVREVELMFPANFARPEAPTLIETSNRQD